MPAVLRQPPSPVPIQPQTCKQRIALRSPRCVPTTLSYYQPPHDGQEPYQYIRDPPLGVARHNLDHNLQPAFIYDLRGSETFTTLDTTGFEFHYAPSREKSFGDDGTWKDNYYAETAQYIKDFTGAKRVFIFEHTVRRNYKGKVGVDTNAPLTRVHIDQTFTAAINRVYRHFPEEAEYLLQSRYRIINFWRPIRHNVAHTPLALLDARSLNVNDLVPIRYFLPDRDSSVFSVQHDPAHQWYYLSDQTPDEISIFKCFDSLDDGTTARCCPHSAFPDSTSPKDAPPRESIEVRALVFDAE